MRIIAAVAGVEKPPRVLDKLKVYQHVLRNWFPHLSATESAVVITITDMSHGWGERGTSTSHKELATRCNISLPTLKRVQKNLVDRGMIESQSTGHGIRYSLNLDWNPDMPVIDRVPKRLKQAKLPPSGSKDLSYQLVSKRATPYITIGIEDSNELVKKTNSSVPEHRGSSKQVEKVSEAKERADKNQVRRIQLRRQKVTTNALRDTWVEAMGEAGYIPLAWVKGSAVTVRGNACAKSLGESWSERSPETLHDFLTWVVHSWKALMASKDFAWMDAPPKAPRIEFVSKWRDKMVDAWLGGVTVSWKDTPYAIQIEDLLLAGKDVEAKALIEKAVG